MGFARTAAHEFFDTDVYFGDTNVVLVMGNGGYGHDVASAFCLFPVAASFKTWVLGCKSFIINQIWIFLMPIARLEHVELDYVDEGDGHPIVLVHGFASSKEANWIDTGWVKLLVDSGYRVIAFDNRGHGGSTKFHSSDDYSLGLMVSDTLALMHMLQLEKPHLMGYSMGARISTRLAMSDGDQIEKLVLAGNGSSMIDGSGDWTPVRDALLADSLENVTDLRGRAFRKFADHTKSDLIALAECVQAVRELFTPEDFVLINNPTLVAIGSEDDIAGSGQVIADLLPNGNFLPIPGRDHMKAVGDKVYKAGVLTFLED